MKIFVKRIPCFKAAILFVSFLCLIAAQGFAGTHRYWMIGEGNWTDASKWNTEIDGTGNPGVPSSDDTAMLAQGGAYTVHILPFSSAVTMTLNIGGAGDGVTLEQQAGSSMASDWEFIGSNGTGAYSQMGGSHHVKVSEHIGWGSLGSYDLAGGDLSVGGTLFIGAKGTGTFHQASGTTHTVNNGISLASDGYTATYTMDGGSLTVIGPSAITVGNGGAGSFIQNDGTVKSNVVMNIGTGSAGTGEYRLKAGTLETWGEGIGDEGKGNFYHTGGTHTVLNGLNLGGAFDASRPGTGEGKYELSGADSVLEVGESEIVGLKGTGIFSQDGGKNSALRRLTLGLTEGSEGDYKLFNGELKVGEVLMPGGEGIEIIGDSGKGTFNQYAGKNMIIQNVTEGRLVVGNGETGDGQYNLVGGDLMATQEIIGAYGTGRFYHTDGSNLIEKYGSGRLVLGDQIGGNGEYSLTGIGKLSAKEEIIGNLGTGVFFHTKGENKDSDTVILGNQTGSQGTYTLKFDGQLTTKNEIVGASGTGFFYQQEGNPGHHITEELIVGRDAGSEGSFFHKAGVLNVGEVLTRSGSEIIGHDGKGTFEQSGGRNFVIDTVNDAQLILGNNGGSEGVYKLLSGNLDTNHEIIGKFGTGHFVQEGGENLLRRGGNLILGMESGSKGTYEFKDGLVSVEEGDIVVGRSGSGYFEQSGGGIGIGTMGSDGKLIIGQEGGSNGTYKFLSGILGTRGTIVGQNGTGEFIQRYGDHSINGSLILGGNPGSLGTYTMRADGIAKVTSKDVLVGGQGEGVFNQENGTNTIFGALVIAADPGSKGTYNLKGGNLSADMIHNRGQFNLKGGDLTADTIYNYDQFSLSGGTLKSGITNAGTFTFSGGQLNGSVWNDGRLEIDGGGKKQLEDMLSLNGTTDNFGTITVTNALAEFVGPVTNTGTIKATDSNVIFSTTFTNNGAYNSDPSNNYFNDLVVQAMGYLTGGAGDNFYVKGDFENSSTQSGLWNTVDALLGFVTGDDAHHLYTLTDTSALFDWGALLLAPGNALEIQGSFADPLYFKDIVLGDGLSQLGSLFSDRDIYYGSLRMCADAGCTSFTDLALSTYDLAGSGRLIYRGSNPPGPVTVPEPSTLFLLAPGLFGLLGLPFRPKK